MQKKARIIGLGLLFLHFFLVKTYRPYIYINKLEDFYLADTLGSLFCVPVTTFIFIGFFRKKIKAYFLIICVTIANLIYESSSLLFQPYSLDYPDLFAILIGACITFYYHHRLVNDCANPTS